MNRLRIFFCIILSVIFLVPGAVMSQEPHGRGHDAHNEHEEHESHEGHEDEGLKVNKDMQKAIGLTFEEARMRFYEEKIKVYGEIAQDTDKYTHITSGDNGVIQTVHVQAGSIVDEHDPILDIGQGDGITETISAPHHGTVIAVHVNAGEKVDHLRSLVSLADLDRLRVSFDVYEKDLRFVSVGQAVKAYSTAYPGRVFEGKVVFVSPRLDKHTQTVKIRADVDNYDHLLRLGMFVTGDLIYSPDGEVLSVSQTAVQQLGDEDVVFLPEGDEFRPVEIKAGREFGNYVEVLSGLSAGQRIVSKGSFALKSELQKGAFGDGHNH